MSCANTSHDKEGLPEALVSPENRLKTETITRVEAKIGRGGFFVGSSKRNNIPTINTYNYVLVAGASGLVVEDLLVAVNFANLIDGHINIDISAYVESSNGNSWSYTPASPLPVGRSVNTDFINNFPVSTIESGVNVADLVGDKDYPLYHVDYLIDTSGNRNMVTQDRSNFLTGDRKILAGAGERVLVQTVLSGDATGTIDISSVFFTSEPTG